ncbi:hypothetical protein HID58_058201 [Brassica napus]|uniref:Uncharacterized protein n=1 Tax=Brassica napus TaxID=3708 RepID=A0ABQ7ZPC3_BRANA|nr:hypothetical protein HID58_058201 [Brassica napus]
MRCNWLDFFRPCLSQFLSMVPYSGEDESGVLKRVKGSFSDPENTVVCVLDNFDDIVDSHACLFLQSLWSYGFHFLFYLFSSVTESNLNEALKVVGENVHVSFAGLWTCKEPPRFPCLETSIH